MLRHIKMKCDSTKRAKKRYDTYYNHIKEQMGWKSPPVSEDSLSDNYVSDSSKDYQKSSDDEES